MSGQLRSLMREVTAKVRARGLDTVYHQENKRNVFYITWFDGDIPICKFIIDSMYIINVERLSDEIFEFLLCSFNNELDLTFKEMRHLRHFMNKWVGEEAAIMAIPATSTAFLDDLQGLEEHGLVAIGTSVSHYYVYLTQEGYEYAKSITP